MSARPPLLVDAEASRVAALYVRVSTKDQTTENQEAELVRWADRLGSGAVRVFSDTASGARNDRTALAAVLAAAHRREFDTLLIWALDRLSREGIGPMTRYVDQLRAAGVRVLSYQEPWLDTAGPIGDLLIAIFGWVAQQERQRISERVRAGQARARAHGVHLGRRPRVVDLEEIRRRRAAGQGWRRIARAMKTPTSTLRRKFEACQKSPGELRHGAPRLAQGSEAGDEGTVS
jgi:DNA invertase Pin-like site-specific DNA recombinase